MKFKNFLIRRNIGRRGETRLWCINWDAARSCWGRWHFCELSQMSVIYVDPEMHSGRGSESRRWRTQWSVCRDQHQQMSSACKCKWCYSSLHACYIHLRHMQTRIYREIVQKIITFSPHVRDVCILIQSSNKSWNCLCVSVENICFACGLKINLQPSGKSR